LVKGFILIRLKKNQLIILSCLILFIVISSSLLLSGVINNSKKPIRIVRVDFFPSNSDISFYCEIADTKEEIQLGLMYREELLEDRGMLFIYNTTSTRCFWMKNCLVPLDMIFIDEDFIVINVKEAEVENNVSDENLKRYCSEKPAKWVVEINKGLCKYYNIERGTLFSFEFV
jgi:uncharacterized membrane protein (UPF0127 family)